MIGASVPAEATQIEEAVSDFDTASPRLATLRNLGEHIADDALARRSWGHRDLDRTMLQVARVLRNPARDSACGGARSSIQ